MSGGNLQILHLTVNGQKQEVRVDVRTSLLTLLREHLGLLAAKRGCEEGECGACAVLVDGRSVQSCLVLAVEMNGHEITTAEALGQPHRLGPVQQAFAETGASQCGFCIPGMLIATEALLRENPNPDAAQVRTALSGNLCRCTGYDRIVKGVLKAAELRRGGKRS